MPEDINRSEFDHGTTKKFELWPDSPIHRDRKCLNISSGDSNLGPSVKRTGPRPTMLHQHHTLGIECKGVLSNGVDRMLVGNRVGVGLTRSIINSFARI